MKQSFVAFFILIALLVTASVVTSVAFAAKPTATSAATSGVTATASDMLVDRERKRLEELFIWKMTEELKLPVEKEASFSDAVRSLNREKSKANSELASALEDIGRAQSIEKSKVRAATEKAVKRYEKAWRAYGDLPLKEVQRLKKILGPELLGQYLIAKAQMAEKLKALSAAEAL